MGAGSEEVVGASERSTMAVVSIDALNTPAIAINAQPSACFRPTMSGYPRLGAHARLRIRPKRQIL